MATTRLRTPANATIVHDCIIFIRELLRNNLTDPNSRGTSLKEEFNGDDSETEFTLTYQPLNVTAVAIGATSQDPGLDYDVVYADKKVIFATAPAAGTNNVDITYTYDSTNQSLVYTDFPETNIAYPIVVISHIGQSEEPVSLGTIYKKVDVTLGIDVFSKTTKQRDEIWDAIYDTLRSNKTLLDSNGLTDETITRAVNVPTQSGKQPGGMHQKSAGLRFVYYATG